MFSRYAKGKYYTLTNPVVLAVSIGAFLTGLLVLAIPGIEPVSLSTYLPGFLQFAWPLAHLIGGALVVYGLLSGREQLEAPGLVLLAFTFTGQAVSVASETDLSRSIVTFAAILSLGAGCGVRAGLLVFWRRGRDG